MGCPAESREPGQVYSRERPSSHSSGSERSEITFESAMSPKPLAGMRVNVVFEFLRVSSGVFTDFDSRIAQLLLPRNRGSHFE